MKRQTVKNIIGSVCFLIVFSLAFLGVSNLLERKGSRIGYAEFWAEPEGYDVWLLGNSHMRHGVQAVELWADYGITSYCLASPGNPIPQTYWTLMNALRYDEPKMVVMDCYHVVKDKKIQKGQKYMHNGIDSIPFSRVKIQMVRDLFEENGKRMEYLFDFYIYHNRWDELGMEDIRPEKSYLKGGLVNSRIRDMSEYRAVEETDMCRTDGMGYVYLRKIIEECQRREIRLLLTAIPCCEGDEEQRGMNAVAEVAKEYGVPFLNMFYNEELGIDLEIDFGDTSHLNWSGGQKITRYIGEYLTEYFPALAEGRSEETTQKWEEHYTGYRKEKIKWLKDEKGIKGFLMRLYDDDFSCRLYRREKPGEKSDPALEKLLAQIPGLQWMDYEEATEAAGVHPDADFIAVVRDSGRGKTVQTAVFKDGKRQKKK